MGINLTPLSARSYSVGASDDPYKKYWWVLLAGFVMTGVWLCMPLMEPSVGSVHVSAAASADAPGAAQSLDSADNPNGAAGGAIDLSMGLSGSKSKEADETTSMLYQGADAPTGAAAAGAPLGAASAATLAQQLKDAGKPKDKDASGWGEKAQRGFDAPHLAGGALGGLGAASGGSSASAGGAGAFGARNANVGFEATRGLQAGGGGAATSAGFKALQAAAGAAASPNLKGSNEAMHASGSAVFDGKKGNVIQGAGTGAFASAGSALNAAPANLKANDPKLDVKKLPDPPSAPAPTTSSSQQMAQMLMMVVATTVVGGVVGSATASVMGMMGMTMMQQHMGTTSMGNTTCAYGVTKC